MNSAKCANCGFVGWADAESCKKCGAAMSPAVADGMERPVNYPAPYSNYGGMRPVGLKTGLAITALVSGILNFTCLSVFMIPVLVGVIVSAVALTKVNRYPQEYGGKPMAIAGLVMNLFAAFVMVPIMLAIAVPNLLASRIAANEGSAQSSMRTVFEAELTYQSTVGRGEYGTLADLERASLITSELASGTKWGYRYKVEVKEPTSSWPARFTVVAVPLTYGSSGRRSFFIDQTGILREEDARGLEASGSSPPVGAERDYPGRRSETRRSTTFTNR
jgi:type IV pilus assembly protein PilA